MLNDEFLSIKEIMEAVKVSGFLGQKQNEYDIKNDFYLGYDELGYYYRCGHPMDVSVTGNFHPSLDDINSKWKLYSVDELINSEKQVLKEKLLSCAFWDKCDSVMNKKYVILKLRNYNFHSYGLVNSENIIEIYYKFKELSDFIKISENSKEWFFAIREFLKKDLEKNYWDFSFSSFIDN